MEFTFIDFFGIFPSLYPLRNLLAPIFGILPTSVCCCTAEEETFESNLSQTNIPISAGNMIALPFLPASDEGGIVIILQV